jgi:AraC family transcriptional regulator, regulatory protein of adaptative response / DNA-3-methyladenine glycosylase II
MELDFERCYRAVASRDARFDGFFFTVVTTTKIYCRPSCPALTPRPGNVRFLPSAAAAQKEGFRACLRCRPDAAPGSPEWNIRADLAGRAMRLIADGVVDRDGVPGLAKRLGYTERHLHRILAAELGAGPIALARAQRAQTARILIETTTLGLAEVAFASGFGSVRQFNDTIREIYGRAPSELRGRAAPTAGALTLRLPYRAPLHAESILDFLGDRAVPGIDGRDGETYTRVLRLPHGAATAALTPRPGHVAVDLALADVRDLAPAVSRCRRLFDLDADPQAVDDVLAADNSLSAAVFKEPGVRNPGATDGFEVGARAVIGQQVSVASARRVLGRLVRAAGGMFPDAATLRDLPDEAFAMPAARRGTLRALAGAVADGGLDLDGGADRAEVRDTLQSLPGIGSWTADYIAMRALGDPDVFLPTDLGVRRGAAALGLSDDPKKLLAYAERWRPWRSYAVIRLWRQS